MFRRFKCSSFISSCYCFLNVVTNVYLKRQNQIFSDEIKNLLHYNEGINEIIK